MSNREISRRSFLQGGLVAGVSVTLTPLSSQALAALMENSVTVTSEQWLGNNGKARARNDACPRSAAARSLPATSVPRTCRGGRSSKVTPCC